MPKKKPKYMIRLYIFRNFVLKYLCFPGHTNNAPRRDYSIKGSTKDRYFGIFNGISIIATTYASGIIPEIQVFELIYFI